MDTVRIGLLGSGYMGRSYAECLKRYTTHGRLAAVTGGSRAPRLAADYGAAYVEAWGSCWRGRTSTPCWWPPRTAPTPPR